MSLKLDKTYYSTLNNLKEKIRQARVKATLIVNTQLLALYWEIGKTIFEQEKSEGWGAKIVETLAIDLKTEFSDMKGLSVRNLRYMRDFACAYPDFLVLQQSAAKIKPRASVDSGNGILQHPVAKLPWGHNCVLLDKAKTQKERLFYATKAAENGWSRDTLTLQINNHLYKRQGKAISNFEHTLPSLQSDLAKETIKNPYIFDFLSISEEMQERDLEKALIQHIKKFMQELGRGFAFVGNQHNINVKGDDYFLDLLFYNYQLHCFVVFELKIGEFKPEFAGKLNFYVNVINEQIKGKEDKPTIGVLLCKTPNDTVVKFALKGIKTPLGVADYELAKALPKQLKGEMPTIAELEAEINKEYKALQKPIDEKMSNLKGLLGKLKVEQVKEKLGPENTRKIFNKVLLPVKKAITETLHEKGIEELFESIQIMIWTDSQGHYSDTKAAAYLKKQIRYNCGELRLEVRADGFKPAGTNAFPISKELCIDMGQYKYNIGINRHTQNSMLEKLYHQLPTLDEINYLVEKFCELLIDDITQQVERITKSKHNLS